MKNDCSNSTLSVLFFLLTLVVAFFSWIGSIYGWGEMQSLLSAEGIRWFLGHVVENYVRCPVLGVVLVLFMGLGIGVQAGLYDVLKRFCKKEKQLSRKERRALSLASVALLMYVALIGASLLLPWNFLHGVTGSWLHSPFAKGLVYLLSVGVGLSGMVYGYASDTFRGLSDVVGGMSYLIARLASGLVTLFFVVQFFASLEYTCLVSWMGMSGNMMEVLYLFFCYLPFFFGGLRARINNKV